MRRLLECNKILKVAPSIHGVFAERLNPPGQKKGGVFVPPGKAAGNGLSGQPRRQETGGESIPGADIVLRLQYPGDRSLRPFAPLQRRRAPLSPLDHPNRRRA